MLTILLFPSSAARRIIQTSKGDPAIMQQTENKQQPTDQPISLGQ